MNDRMVLGRGLRTGALLMRHRIGASGFPATRLVTCAHISAQGCCPKARLRPVSLVQANLRGCCDTERRADGSTRLRVNGGWELHKNGGENYTLSGVTSLKSSQPPSWILFVS